MMVTHMSVGFIACWIKEALGIRCIILAYWGFRWFTRNAINIYKRTITYHSVEDGAFPYKHISNTMYMDIA